MFVLKINAHKGTLNPIVGIAIAIIVVIVILIIIESQTHFLSNLAAQLANVMGGQLP